jgi:hypothetical protein
MTPATVEIRLTLSATGAHKLYELAQARGVSESEIVEQALGLFNELGDIPHSNDYWFSVAAMREDWDSMPEDWIADEDSNALSPR